MNPEFMRNLWSEFSPHRLVAMPLVLGLAVSVAWMGGSAGTAASTANTMAGVLLIAWGARLAADSVLGEVVDRTWDSQRMSAIGPWSMVWGKLFGGTAFVWYGALMCAAAALVAGDMDSAPSPFRIGIGGFSEAVPPDAQMPIRLIAVGLFAQAMAMFVALLLLRGRPPRLRFRVTVTQVAAIGLALPFLMGSSAWQRSPISWYGLEFDRVDFLYMTNLIFIAWAIFGCYRLMRLELQCRTGFAGWLCFTLFLPTYVAGIDVTINWSGWLTLAVPTMDRWFVAFLITLALTYVAAFAEPKGIVRLRRWLHDLSEGSPRSAAATTPSWAVSGIICLVCAIITIALSMLFGDQTSALTILVLSILLFAVRDLALLYALTLDSRRQRGHLAALVYLAVLYGLIPAFLDGAGAESLIPAVRPTPGGDPGMSLLPVAAQALAAYAAAVMKWRRVLRRSDVMQPAAA